MVIPGPAAAAADIEPSTLSGVDLRSLGQRLQVARSRRGLTQHDVAQALDVARTTVTAIEKGERRVRPGELLRMAALYGVPVGDLVRERPPVGDFSVQFRTLFRRAEAADAQVEDAVFRFQQLCEDYLELESLCDAPLKRRYPDEYDLLQSDQHGIAPEAAGDELAIRERNRLGLGDGPIGDLRHLLEHDVGLRVFLMGGLPAKLAAMFAYTDELGGCIAVNAAHPLERRRVSLAHEYAHFLTTRRRAEITELGRYQRLPAPERLANAFAISFLLPEAGVRPRFQAIQRARGGLASITPADLCTLADYYTVSFEALVLRLEDLRLLPLGTWEHLKASGFKVREAQSILTLSGAHRPAEEFLPLRYQLLAVTAYTREEVSEGMLARFLRVGPVETRDVVRRLATQVMVTDDGAAGEFSLSDLGQLVAG
jgi:Zn-dependent peptidase ImmA (M78 family)/DNA-binding XRE family transcriptional regulator